MIIHKSKRQNKRQNRRWFYFDLLRIDLLKSIGQDNRQDNGQDNRQDQSNKRKETFALIRSLRQLIRHDVDNDGLDVDLWWSRLSHLQRKWLIEIIK